MSSRQLRKLQQQRELEQAKWRKEAKLDENISEEADEDDDDDEGYIAPPKSKPSLFANFAALEDNEGEEEEDDDSDDGVPPADEDKPPPAPKSKKNKKKKKKKAKAKEGGTAEDNKGSDKTQDQDDIDKALKELKLEATKNEKNAEETTLWVDPEFERVCKLLSISTQHLKVGNEMKNLFGRTAIENHDDAGGPVRRGGRRQRVPQQVDLETALKGHHAPGKGLPEVTLRRNIFIQGKEEWPRAPTGGLTMEIVDNDLTDGSDQNGTVEFRYVHDNAYETVQQQFDMFVEMGEPQNLIGLLQRNPYHISLLLQVSKIAKDQGDHALSSDLVERALFSFARASLSSFSKKISEGKATLSFARPENREFFLAGYQYIKSLMMKGTYRTALEWAKLLFSLNIEYDPYCMLLMIHHLAIRSQENQFLLSFADSDAMKMSLISSNHTTPSLSLAAMQLRQGAKCRQLLGKAIRELPWLFCKLFQELNLDSPPPSIWGAVPRTEAETLFTEIYVRQTKDLWNTPEATSLLMEVAHATNVSIESIPGLSDSAITLDVARFVYLDNTPELMAMVPSNLMHGRPTSDSDPLPPDVNIFSWDSQKRNFVSSRDQHNGAFDDHFNPLAAIRALIPGFNPFNRNEGEETEDRELHSGDSDDEGNADEPTDEASLRARLERTMTSHEADAVLENMAIAGEPTGGPGLLSRAYQFLWGHVAHPTATSGGGSHTAATDEADEETDTESEEEMGESDTADRLPH